MSDTPRTDALLLEINEGRVYETAGPVTELACTLERENAELLEALKEIVRGDVGATFSGSQCVEIAQAALAKLEGK